MTIKIKPSFLKQDTERDDQFEAFFENMNASWGFEGMALSQKEKKLLQLRATGQLSHDEYLELIH